MSVTMTAHRLPPRMKIALRLTTAGLALLVVAAVARMAPLVMKPKAGPETVLAEKPKPLGKTGAGLMGSLPLSASPPAPAGSSGSGVTAPPPPPPLDITGLNLKGVFVNIFDKRRSLVIISQKGGKDLILKRGDMARQGVMVDEVSPDHVVFKGINGDTKSIHLSDFVKDTVIMGAGMQGMPTSIADMEDPMGAPLYDPTSPGPGMPGDIAGDGGMDSGPVKYMPIPTMPGAQHGGGAAALAVPGSGAERDISRQMNAAQKLAEQGR